MGFTRRVFLIIPVISAAIALSLGIVLLVAGSSDGTADNYYWLSLNTSKIGQSIVKFTPATTPSSGENNPLDPLGIGSTLNNIFGGIVDNLTSIVDSGIQDLEGQLIGNLTKAIGIKDFYQLYLTGMCEGNYVNANDPNSGVDITKCSSYSDENSGLAKVSNAIPSSFVIGTTNVSVPLVTALGSASGGTASLAKSGALAMTVLLIIASVCSGLVFVLSAATFFIGFRKIVIFSCMFFSTLGSVVRLSFALVMTGIILAGSSTIDGLGAAFTIHTKVGSGFLTLGWIGAVFSLIGSGYWFLMWFVVFRETSFARRWRTSAQMGNWRGIFREVLMDLRAPKRAKKDLSKDESQLEETPKLEAASST